MVTHKFINGLRFHQTVAGDFPGVTTVLGATEDHFAKTAIRKWKQRIGEEEANKIRDDACTRGDHVHLSIETYFNGLTPIANSAIDSTNILTKGFLDYVAENIKYTKVRVEDALFSSKGYAGSIDLIAQTDKGLVIYDWKTSTKRKTKSYIKDYFLQIAAYWAMADERFQEDVQEAHIILGYVDDNNEAIITDFLITKDDYEVYYKAFLERLTQFKYDTFYM